jgi:hypothetical protein
VYYDSKYLFLYRHYGSATDPGGNTEPGLFVHSKTRDRWLQITSISTRGGRFGRSWSEDPAERRRLDSISVGWNFTGYANVPFVDLPLRTSGSIAFPYQIEDDAENDQYRLRFMSKLGVASAETVLLVAKKDLAVAFGDEVGSGEGR